QDDSRHVELGQQLAVDLDATAAADQRAVKTIPWYLPRQEEDEVRHAARRHLHDRAEDEAADAERHQRANEDPGGPEDGLRVESLERLEREEPEDAAVPPQ